MTDKEEILVKRVGCLAQIIVQYIRKYPDLQSREVIASRIGMTSRTVSPVLKHLIDINVLHEEGCKFSLTNKFTIQPETEWKVQ